MTIVRINRRYLGWFLLIGTPVLITLLIFFFRESTLSWPMLLLLPVTLGFGYLIYQWIADPPQIIIGDGWFEILRRPFRSIRIPLEQIKSAHIRRPYGDEGRTYFLEIALHAHTPETEPLKDTFVKRETIKLCQRFGTYVPPDEPFLILQTSLLNVSDAELGALVKRECPSPFPPNVEACALPAPAEPACGER